ncbi:MAG: hypothetical protein ISN28_05170 [Ectothiorhodospiraceae bacterium AqS1]|nr:hypothetical protein [Ectothiorhodospiraceae bacterium AqS1]MBF2759643.1 hypothetical protein [Ectothiorhodospiraceae bacterium AqS1]
MPTWLIWVLVAIASGIFILQLWLILTLLSAVRRIDGALAKVVQRGGLPVSRRSRKDERDE